MNNKNFKEVNDFTLSEMADLSFNYLNSAIDNLSNKLVDLEDSDVCATICTLVIAYIKAHPEINKELFVTATALTLMDSVRSFSEKD